MQQRTTDVLKSLFVNDKTHTYFPNEKYDIGKSENETFLTLL